MHQIFELPELLRIIFDNLERVDRVKCTLVNTVWSEVALDVIWHEVDDLRILLNALSPVEQQSDDYASNLPGIFRIYDLTPL